ncbi:MAG: hypothetical protein QOE70_5531 [Chthoniobacter sp.]|jgi:hypothetical protein|nr:hypothetical protein [Chthoniobacter sp.]
MNTRERATHLAAAAGQFPFLSEATTAVLYSLVGAELGDPGILDDFRRYGTHLTKAVPHSPILHVISGNTPAAGLQSLIRGLLLGAHNLCKMPTPALPEIAKFRQALPPELAERVEICQQLPKDWIARAEAVIVFGDDETVADFRGRMRADQVFIAHGQRLSCGVIFEDPKFESAAAAARDASLSDELGCLSPHVFYVGDDPLDYAIRLAEEMESFNARQPRGAIALADVNAIHNLREELSVRAAHDPRVAVFKSNGTAWTVACDPGLGFPRSPLHRFVYVKSLPNDLAAELEPVRQQLSAIGVWPATLEHLRRVAGFGASRLCPVGRMQLPAWTWHQDGKPALLPLVRWVDAEAQG